MITTKYVKDGSSKRLLYIEPTSIVLLSKEAFDEDEQDYPVPELDLYMILPRYSCIKGKTHIVVLQLDTGRLFHADRDYIPSHVYDATLNLQEVKQ